MTRHGAVRIANCSGFYGDRVAAARDMLSGPAPIDVLSGDYLAELTMLILWKARLKDSSAGYATTFLRQMEDVLGTCLERGVRVVSNAGGLNAVGLAERLAEIAARTGLSPRIAVVEGDDIIDRLAELQAGGEAFVNLDTGQPLAAAGVEPVTANAYLGGWGIASALTADADIVICGRVTDAALVVGPAAWWHGWARDDWDRLAGAVVAGHIIECGTQACGGNYSLLHELPDARYPGFPIAEIEADGSCTVTKQPGTGGAVTIGTVTAQLLYEIAGPAYPNPDVIARFDTITLAQHGPHQVRVSGVRGEPAPDQLKVAINYPGGYRNSMTMVLTGLDIEAKAARAEAMLWELLGAPDQFDAVDVHLVRSDRGDAPTNELATARLQVTVKDRDPAKVGRRFSSAVTELALASYAGFFTLAPPSAESAYGVYWPALVGANAVHHTVRLPDGTCCAVPHSTSNTAPASPTSAAPTAAGPAPRSAASPTPAAPTAAAAGPTSAALREAPGGAALVRAPLGRICGARSGDKGGNANVGVWTWDEEAFRWLAAYLSVARFRDLLPEAAQLDVQRYDLPNLWALNFVVVGLLGEGVASSARADPQAKGLGEYLRSRLVDLPAALLASAGPASAGLASAGPASAGPASAGPASAGLAS